MAEKLDPIPPGKILLEEFMRPYGVSQNRLARGLRKVAQRTAGEEIKRGLRPLEHQAA